MFDIVLLRTFEAVAGLSSFTKAGQQLNLTQSAVSAHVRRLEEQAGAALALFVLTSAFVAAAFVGISSPLADEPTAAQRMSEPGPLEQMLAKQAGTWDVMASLWTAPGAKPIVAHGLVAERIMIGPILQEIMKPSPGSNTPDFTRIDYLNFDRVEGRWKYVSMDTRFPVSIMPARSFGPAVDGKIDVQFEPQGFVGFGSEVEGRFMVSDMAISSSDVNHMLKEQHVMVANGTGKGWLFVRYEYTRRH